MRWMMHLSDAGVTGVTGVTAFARGFHRSFAAFPCSSAPRGMMHRSGGQPPRVATQGGTGAPSRVYV